MPFALDAAAGGDGDDDDDLDDQKSIACESRPNLHTE